MADATDLGQRMEGAVNVLADIAAHLVPETVSGADATRLTRLAIRAERSARVIKALAARRVSDCSSHRDSGCRSAAEWLAQEGGTSLGAAKRTLDQADRTANKPEVDEAWRSGELSSEQTEEIADAVDADPSAESQLVDRARHDSLRNLSESCRRVEAAARSREEEQARHNRLHESRYARTWVDRDGVGRVDARLTPEALAHIQSALRPFTQAAFDEARAAGRRERHDAYAADGLVAMARAARARTSPAPAAGPTEASTDASGAPSTVIAVISHEALLRGSTQPGETCRMDGVGSVPVASVQAMAGDAFWVAVVQDEQGDIRNVVHLGRHPTARQRTALAVRDPVCVVPGCQIGHGLEIDHVTPWAASHQTTINELARLCRIHHRMKTYEGWTLTGPPGHWQWRRPASAGDSPDASARAGSDPPERLFA